MTARLRRVVGLLVVAADQRRVLLGGRGRAGWCRGGAGLGGSRGTRGGRVRPRSRRGRPRARRRRRRRSGGAWRSSLRCAGGRSHGDDCRLCRWRSSLSARAGISRRRRWCPRRWSTDCPSRRSPHLRAAAVVVTLGRATEVVGASRVIAGAACGLPAPVVATAGFARMAFEATEVVVVAAADMANDAPTATGAPAAGPTRCVATGIAAARLAATGAIGAAEGMAWVATGVAAAGLFLGATGTAVAAALLAFRVATLIAATEHVVGATRALAALAIGAAEPATAGVAVATDLAAAEGTLATATLAVAADEGRIATNVVAAVLTRCAARVATASGARWTTTVIAADGVLRVAAAVPAAVMIRLAARVGTGMGVVAEAAVVPRTAVGERITARVARALGGRGRRRRS